MNYRHAFHAGSFADVVKHAVLVRILAHLRAKPAPFRVIDTHAGAGLYDLAGPQDVDVASYWRRVFQDLRRTTGAFGEINKTAYIADGTMVQDLTPQPVKQKDGTLKIRMMPTPSRSTQHAVAYSDFLKRENGKRVRIERASPWRTRKPLSSSCSCTARPASAVAATTSTANAHAVRIRNDAGFTGD